jgi:hypothetical protein
MKKSQIKRMFYVAGTLQDKLTEGVWDKVNNKLKGATSKMKTTQDKLMTSWEKAGNPSDNSKVKKIMQQAGVDDGIIASSMKAADGQATPANTTTPPTDATTPAQTTAASATPVVAQPVATVDAQTQNFILQLVNAYTALTPEEKAQLKRELEDAVTASDVGNNIVKATNENKKFSKRVGR